MNVLDWRRAAEIVAEHADVDEICAGISGDWFWTGGVIAEKGQRVYRDSWLPCVASSWGTPVVVIDRGDERIEIACYRTISAEEFDARYPEGIHQLWPACDVGEAATA